MAKPGRYRVDEKVTIIPSVADVERLKRDPRAIVARVVERRGRPDEVWITWQGGPVLYGPLSALEMFPGWAGE